MRRDVATVLVTLACLLLAGCLAGSPIGPLAPSVEERPLPERPETLTNASVLEYAVDHEGVYQHNRIVREHDASSIEGIGTCSYPADDPQDGALDYWMERRVGDEFYLTLRCPVDIDERGAEQSGSGMVGKWTTYAVTPEATSRVELGTNVVRVSNRTVNFDDEPHTVRVTVRAADGGDPIVERAYDVDAHSYERIRAIAPDDGTYRLRVRVDDGPATSSTVTASEGGNLLDRTGIYVSPGGQVVIDRRTETYLDG